MLHTLARIVGTSGTPIPLTRLALEASRVPVTRAFVLALLLFGVGAENALGGSFGLVAGSFDSGPGDAGVAFVGGRRFAIYLDFDSNEIVCRDANANFGVASRQPTGPQPRQMVVVNNRFVVVANSGDNTVSAYVIGEDGKLTRTSNVSSEGLEPFDVGLFLGAVYVVNRGSNELSIFDLDKLGELTFFGKVPTGRSADLVDVSSRGLVAVGNSGAASLRLSFLPRATYSRSESDASRFASQGEQYQALLEWRPFRPGEFEAVLGASGDWSRSRFGPADPGFTRRYTGTLSIRWGVGVSSGEPAPSPASGDSLRPDEPISSRIAAMAQDRGLGRMTLGRGF